jgi:hypothetical protein
LLDPTAGAAGRVVAPADDALLAALEDDPGVALEPASDDEPTLSALPFACPDALE